MSRMLLWCALVAFLFPVVARGDILATPFNSDNSLAGNMFNVDVVYTNGIVVEAFDLNLEAGFWNVELYVISGNTYNGNESSPAAWTLVDSAGLTGAGIDNLTFWDFNDVNLGAGDNAFYVTTSNGNGMHYTNGTTEGDLLAGDANLEIFQGTGNLYPFGVHFAPRNWNGRVHYSVQVIPEPTGLVLLLLGTILWPGRGRR